MGKINWIRVFLGGLIAGAVGNVFQFVAWMPLVGRSLRTTLQTYGYAMQETVSITVFKAVWIFVMGIVAVWFYAAIRPRYGAGPGTAVLAGVIAGFLMGVFPDIAWGLVLRLIPAKVWLADAIFSMVAMVIVTVLGAWVYKEQEP